MFDPLNSKIILDRTGGPSVVFQKAMDTNVPTGTLRPVGIQVVFLVDERLSFAAKIPTGFVVRNRVGQLAGKSKRSGQ